MKFNIYLIVFTIFLLEKFIKATKFGPMAESLAHGDVEYRFDEVKSLNLKEDTNILKLNTKSKTKLSALDKNINSTSLRKQFSKTASNNHIHLTNKYFYCYQYHLLLMLVVIFF